MLRLLCVYSMAARETSSCTINYHVSENITCLKKTKIPLPSFTQRIPNMENITNCWKNALNSFQKLIEVSWKHDKHLELKMSGNVSPIFAMLVAHMTFYGIFRQKKFEKKTGKNWWILLPFVSENNGMKCFARP